MDKQILEYSEEDARKTLGSAAYQFVVGGARPVRGIANAPTWFELNADRKDKLSVVAKSNGLLIIVPLVGRISGASETPVRKGDTLSILLRGGSQEEAIEIAKLLANHVRFDVDKIKSDDIGEWQEIVDFLSKTLPVRMRNKKGGQE